MATLAALLSSALFYFYGHGLTGSAAASAGYILLFVGAVLLLAPLLCYLSLLGPVQKADRASAPRVAELFYSDDKVFGLTFFVMLVAFFSFAGAINLIAIPLVDNRWVLLIWLVAVGLAIDTLVYLVRHMAKYMSPNLTVDMFVKQARKNIRNEKEGELFKWIDALSETASKAIDKSTPSLCESALDGLSTTMRTFLQSSKSISHHDSDEQMQKMGIGDKVSYTLTFFFERIAPISAKAVEKKLSSISTRLINISGKVIFYAAQYDITLVSLPLHYLGRFANDALESGVTDVGLKAMLTLEEVAKSIVTDIDVTYLEIKEPMAGIIGYLSDIAKELFRQNKNISISMLEEPFKELKKLFESEKLSRHQDTPAILMSLNAVIDEFETLAVVLNTMPPLPDLEKLQQQAGAAEAAKVTEATEAAAADEQVEQDEGQDRQDSGTR